MEFSRISNYWKLACSQSAGWAAAPPPPQACQHLRGGAGGEGGPKSKPDASNTRLRVSLMRLSRALAVETPSST
jgi:hypothetical protein